MLGKSETATVCRRRTRLKRKQIEQKKMNKFNPQELISERIGDGRGDFANVAEKAQELKRFAQTREHTSEMALIEQEALDNICSKIARIICRKSQFDIDSWRDIAGYATLIVNHIESEEKSDDNYVES